MRLPHRVGVLSLFAGAALLAVGAAPPHEPPILGDANTAGFVALPRIPAGFSSATLTPLPPARRPAVYVGDDLTRVPEVSLETRPKEKLARSVWENRKGLSFAAALHLNAAEQDGYLKAVLKHRPDLAGLPLTMGDACRLTGKARLALNQTLDRSSWAVLPQTPRRGMPGRRRTAEDEAAAETAKETAALLERATVAVVAQKSGPGQAAERCEAVKTIGAIPRPEATRELARMAIFSAEIEVRGAALEALSGRGEHGYSAVLVDALAYPWPAVAGNAAEAIVRLKRVDLLPRLVDVLDRPDPREPRPGEAGGKKAATARELVRINHHHNCLLCHASARTLDLPWWESAILAAIPLPSDDLGAQAYGRQRSNLLVRIDVTYLRQDFSIMQKVADAAPWPEMQRFDFVVRKRVLTEAEAADLRERLKPPTGKLSPYQEAAVSALRKLTGRDFGADAAAWRQHLKLPPA